MIGDVEVRTDVFLESGILLGLMFVSLLRRLSCDLWEETFELADFERVDLIPKDILKALFVDLEDGNEFSVLECGASRERRFFVLATLPQINSCVTSTLKKETFSHVKY